MARRTPEQSQYLASSLAQFWDAANRIFALAASGHDADARAQIRLSLQARQAALSTAVARLLVENNESEEQTARRVQDIYAQVQRQVYFFLGATFVVIALTSLYLIRSNRELFARLTTPLVRAARAGAAAHRHARVDAPRDFPRAARRVRPGADRDGIDARPRRPACARWLAVTGRAARDR